MTGNEKIYLTIALFSFLYYNHTKPAKEHNHVIFGISPLYHLQKSKKVVG